MELEIQTLDEARMSVDGIIDQLRAGKRVTITTGSHEVERFLRSAVEEKIESPDLLFL
jgi:hypothetical protein